MSLAEIKLREPTHEEFLESLGVLKEEIAPLQEAARQAVVDLALNKVVFARFGESETRSPEEAAIIFKKAIYHFSQDRSLIHMRFEPETGEARYTVSPL